MYDGLEFYLKYIWISKYCYSTEIVCKNSIIC